MRISERSNPLLKYLKWKRSLYENTRLNRDNDFLFNTPYDQNNQPKDTYKAIQKLMNDWGGIAKKYAVLPIELPSTAFIQALERSSKSFEKLIVEFARNGRFSGVFIGHTRQTAFLYDFQNIEGLFEREPDTGKVIIRKDVATLEKSYCQFIILGAKCDTLQAYVDTREEIYFITEDPILWGDSQLRKS